MATQNNKPLLHRKEWQAMAPAPVTNAAAMFMISDQSDNANYALYFTSNTVQYLYSHADDSFTQITSGAFAGSFQAGACGCYHPWSIAYTATGGTHPGGGVNDTITVAAATHNISYVCNYPS